MRTLLIAAHPDDETVGASALLGCRDEVNVVHATNGAPRDARWWPAGVTERVAYVRERDREARRALSIVAAERFALGFDDQELVFVIRELVASLASVISRLAPDLIVTHAYEGGHPDHDAVAFAVSACRDEGIIASHIPVFEMSGYHADAGSLRIGAFLGQARAYPLDPRQRARRHDLLRAYRSQQATLAPFTGLGHECYRPAPKYDFSRPPHAGPLYYELLGMKPGGAEWRAHIERARCSGRAFKAEHGRIGRSIAASPSERRQS